MSRRRQAIFLGGDSEEQVTLRHRNRFAKHVRALNKLLEEIQEYEPEAEYYLACDTLNLMIGPSHEGSRGVAHQERVACSMTLVRSDGGDW